MADIIINEVTPRYVLSHAAGRKQQSNRSAFMLTIDYDEVLSLVRTHDVTVVGVQLPAGLRRKAGEIAAFLEGHGYEVIFSGDPSYGACDVADRDMAEAGAGMLLHFGHSPMLAHAEIPVAYVEVQDDIPLVPAVAPHVDVLRKYGTSVALVTTVQHVRGLPDVASFLSSQGFDPFIGSPGSRVAHDGQVLGCSFEAARIPGAHFCLYLGTGYFHPVGIALATDLPVLYCNPYTGECNDISALKDKIVRKRYAVMVSAESCERFGILVSTKPGQYRREEAQEIQNLLRAHKKKCQLIYAREITMSLVCDYDHEAYVVVACPRIAVDDAETFTKPVLTAAEARLMLEGGAYVFDEIHTLPR